MLIDTIISNVKSSHNNNRDAGYMWLAYGQNYYRELMHMSGLVNDTRYDSRMPDVLRPY